MQEQINDLKRMGAMLMTVAVINAYPIGMNVIKANTPENPVPKMEQMDDKGDKARIKDAHRKRILK